MQNVTSKVAPGQPVPLLVNYHKLGTKQNVIYVYKLTFDQHVNPTKLRETKRAVKSVKDFLFQDYGVFNSYGTTLVAQRQIQ
jgi:hypothetical protein